MMGSSNKTKSVAEANIIGQTESITKVIGRRTKCMGRGCSFGKTESGTKASSLMINEKARAHSSGQTAGNI
jgi:hypothetical protein